jgi:hypothetical protein
MNKSETELESKNLYWHKQNFVFKINKNAVNYSDKNFALVQIKKCGE